MNRKTSIKPEKIALYGEPIEMTPQISLYGNEPKPTKLVQPVNFWPDPKEIKDGRLPANK